VCPRNARTSSSVVSSGGATPRPPRDPCGVLIRRLGGDLVKKILALAAVAGAVLLIVRRSRSAKAEADLWREATAPTDK